MSKSTLRVLRLPLLPLLVLLAPVAAHAQPAPATISEADWDVRSKLIKAAESAHKTGDHAKALELGQRAGALQMSPAVRYFIAQEQEETGALVEAFAGAQRCARDASLDPSVAPTQRELLVSRCQEMQTRLRARVAHIVIRADQVPEGLKVKLSGQTLNHAAIGIPYLVQPGRLVVEAVAPGYLPYHLDITVSEGQTINVTLQLTPAVATAGGRGSPVCPVGQNATADGRCVSDACRVGMVRTGDGIHCCWPGQSFSPETETCRGAPMCPVPLEARGEGCSDAASAPSTPTAFTTKTGEAQVEAGGAMGPPRPNYRRWGSGLMIGGAGALVLGGGFWLLSDTHFRSLRDACEHPSGCSNDTYQSGQNNVKRYDRLALAGLITGSALALTGAGLYYFSSTTPGPGASLEAPRTRRIAFALDPIGRSGTFRLDF